ncbi:MAG: ISAs1 family transposase [Lachnospiraceae bacterium]|nr:ISAs1 family transposase [Lachnospiraceae bacterium]
MICIKYLITRNGTNEIIIEERYFLCSIKPIAELFAIVARRHWHIENNLHWALDIVFREDRLRSKEKNGIHNLGLVRRFVLFILKLLKAYYHRSKKRIRKKCVDVRLFVVYLQKSLFIKRFNLPTKL